MLNCPHCSYTLVLLSHRRKYTCAKCGRLYLQKTIEDRDFRIWNIAQREIDVYNLLAEIKQKKLARKKLVRTEVNKEKQQQSAREYRKKYALMNKEKLLAHQRARYWKNHEQSLERCRIYREKNVAKRTQSKKLWIAKNKEHYRQWLKSYLEKNKEQNKLKGRLHYWRMQQAKLAKEMLQNRVARAYAEETDHSFSTFGLSEVLRR